MPDKKRPIAIATSAKMKTLIPDEQLLVDALVRRGFVPQPVAWTDPAVDWKAYEAIVIRATWDYYERETEFRAWLQSLAGQRVLNPVPVILGNLDKRYLRT